MKNARARFKPLAWLGSLALFAFSGTACMGLQAAAGGVATPAAPAQGTTSRLPQLLQQLQKDTAGLELFDAPSSEVLAAQDQQGKLNPLDPTVTPTSVVVATTTAPTPTPTPNRGSTRAATTATALPATPTPLSTATPTATTTATPTPTPTATSTPTPTATPSPTATATPTATASPTPRTEGTPPTED